MMPEEKEQLLALLESEAQWARDAEARAADGQPVQYDDPAAVSWDLTGALCHLFGWHRACVLFAQLDRHIHGKRFAYGWPARDPSLDAMAALQAFNDSDATTFNVLREHLAAMPAWHGAGRGGAAVRSD